MEFANPFALGLALLAVPLLVLLLASRPRGHAVPGTFGLARLAPTFRVRLLRVLPVLRITAVILLAVALARPRIADATSIVPSRGIDIALSLDISSSMEHGDLGGGRSRLEGTKEVLERFVEGRENDRIGLVVFQEDALALSPPTLDYAALQRIISDTKSGLLVDGTGIGVGIATALNMLRDSTAASRIVILLTDGQHNAASISPEDAASLAKTLNVKVYTIGVVSPEADRSRDIDEPRLEHIAETTGGRYFLADNEQALAAVYDEIGRLETSAIGGRQYERFTELAPWFLGTAAGLIAIELLLRSTWLRRNP